MAESVLHLTLDKDDELKMLVAKSNSGSSNVHPSMQKYFKAEEDGNKIDMQSTWKQLVMAAEAIDAVSNPRKVFIMGLSKTNDQAEHRFSELTNATDTNVFFRDWDTELFPPSLLISSNSAKEKYRIPIFEKYLIPVIEFCDLDTNCENIDIVIPCNTRSSLSISLMWWMLTREVLRYRGVISRETEWPVNIEKFYNWKSIATEMEE